MIVSGSFIQHFFKNVKKNFRKSCYYLFKFQFECNFGDMCCAWVWKGGGVRKLSLTDYKSKTDSIKGVIHH